MQDTEPVRIDSETISRIVYESVLECSHSYRSDYLKALNDCRGSMTKEGKPAQGLDAIESILENARIGQETRAPICQDTGYVWVCLEIGPNVQISGDIFSGVDKSVASAHRDGGMRASLVRDALANRENTKDNTPAFCEIDFSDRPGARLTVMLKGGGSDNASKVAMLSPGAGTNGIYETVLDHVKAYAENACPPLVVGVGIGSTFDKVVSLSKRALLRQIGLNSPVPETASMENDLLSRINELQIGPGGLGGYPTAIAVNIETAPCHIAALPLAINLGCCAMRAKTVEI